MATHPTVAPGLLTKPIQHHGRVSLPSLKNQVSHLLNGPGRSPNDVGTVQRDIPWAFGFFQRLGQRVVTAHIHKHRRDTALQSYGWFQHHHLDPAIRGLQIQLKPENTCNQQQEMCIVTLKSDGRPWS